MTANSSAADTRTIKAILERVEVSVEKLTEISSDLTKLLAVHEHRLTIQEQLTSELKQYAEKRRDETEDELKDIRQSLIDIKDELHLKLDEQKKGIVVSFESKIEEVKKRLGSFEKWMYGAMGGGGLLYLLVEKAPQLLHLAS